MPSIVMRSTLLHPFFTDMLSIVCRDTGWTSQLGGLFAIFQEEGVSAPLAVQERDGFKTQLEALRDKISSLSRDLAMHEDAGADKVAAIRGFESKITDLKETVQSLQKHSAGLQGQLEVAWAEASETAARMTELQAGAAILQEQAASTARAWKHEQLLLVQVRVAPCMNQSTRQSEQVCVTAYRDKPSKRPP
jgi:chromosome segregation ATPase